RSVFFPHVAGRAYRRPATSDDSAELGEIFDLAVASGDAALPFRSVVQAVLTSPHFLYRTEIGPQTGSPHASFRLTAHEGESLLSYSLLGHPPPAALLAAADRGELTQPASLRTTLD